jgi:hypothetical protein
MGPVPVVSVGDVERRIRTLPPPCRVRGTFVKPRHADRSVAVDRRRGGPLTRVDMDAVPRPELVPSAPTLSGRVEALILHWSGLIRQAAHRFGIDGVDEDELIQDQTPLTARAF